MFRRSHLVLALVCAELACSAPASPPCKTDRQCADREDCTRDACVDGACVHVPDDAIVPTQRATGACERTVCRAGVRVQVNADDASPEDGADCTVGRCVDGRPVHVPDDARCRDPGACRRAVCDPSGARGTPDANGCVVLADEARLPEDEVDCTLDLCTGRTPSNVPRHERCAVPELVASCVVARCVAGTGCVVERSDAACDDGNSCTADTCAPDVSGADRTTGCVHSSVSVAVQIAGNCRRERCVGGISSDEVDDADVPPEADGVACTVPSCAAGVPSERPIDARCDDGLACTVDSCHALRGCVASPAPEACASGLACDPTADAHTTPSGCVSADTCPPRLQLQPGTLTAGDTTGFVDDLAPSCASVSGRPDLAYSIHVDAASDLHVEVRADHDVALVVVPVEAGACGSGIACAAGASGTSLELRNLAAGTYALIVDGDGVFELMATVSPAHHAAGDLLITEFLPDPAAVDDASGEWIEIHNPGTAARTTLGMTLSKDAGATASPLVDPAGRPIFIPANGYIVGVRKIDPATNGGVVASFVLPFALTNTPSEKLQIKAADGTVLDALDLSAAGFPRATAGRSFQLDRGIEDASANDAFTAWCATPTATFGAGDRGTPGRQNESCRPGCTSDAACADTNVCTRDRCDAGTCVHPNDDTLTPPDDGIACTTLRCVSGAVNVTLEGDAACDDGVACTVEACTNAGCTNTPDDALCGSGLVCDRLAGCITPRTPGDTCDHAIVAGTGVVAGDGAHLTDDVAPSCATASQPDLFLRVTLSRPSNIAVRVEPPDASRVVALLGGSCNAPTELACVAGPLDVRGLGAGDWWIVIDDSGAAPFEVQVDVVAGEPSAGSLVVSEIQADPASPLDDASAEWVELANPGPHHVATSELRFVVGTSQPQSIAATPRVLAPGKILLGARKADSAANGGLVTDFVFSGSLGNTGGSVQVKTTSGALVDGVTYSSNANGFPRIVAGKSLQLDVASINAAANDLGGNWCNTRAAAYDASGANFGTPGVANHSCAP